MQIPRYPNERTLIITDAGIGSLIMSAIAAEDPSIAKDQRSVLYPAWWTSLSDIDLHIPAIDRAIDHQADLLSLPVIRDHAGYPAEDQSPSSTGPSLGIHQSRMLLDAATLAIIAKIYYGKELGSVISQANPRVDPLKLRVGMTLRIPTDPNNIQGMVANQPTTPGVIPQTTQPSPVVEYMIQSGDSLSKIASRFYGSARYEDFIYDNNKDILKSKDAIGIGQVLKLPPLPESSNTDE